MYVCVFLLHKNLHTTRKVRTLLGNENILAYLRRGFKVVSKGLGH